MHAARARVGALVVGPECFLCWGSNPTSLARMCLTLEAIISKPVKTAGLRAGCWGLSMGYAVAVGNMGSCQALGDLLGLTATSVKGLTNSGSSEFPAGLLK